MSAPQTAKRPMGLSAALTLCLLFGMWGASDGCSTLGMYASGLGDPPMEMLAVGDPAQRQLISEAYQRLVEQTEIARGPAELLGAAAMVLGMATIFVTMRAFARSQSARALLWQLQLAQAALALSTHLLLPNVQHAWVDLSATTQRAHAVIDGKSEQELAALDQMRPWLHRAPRISAVVRVALGLGVVWVLTRRSTRDYFDAQDAEPHLS